MRYLFLILGIFQRNFAVWIMQYLFLILDIFSPKIHGLNHAVPFWGFRDFGGWNYKETYAWIMRFLFALSMILRSKMKKAMYVKEVVPLADFEEFWKEFSVWFMRYLFAISMILRSKMNKTMFVKDAVPFQDFGDFWGWN